ncbi:MAG: hypothetical protein JJU00_19155, partial [Opitutales bacterium]|nr:hypothetical protein [Opitutales bacterium]
RGRVGTLWAERYKSCVVQDSAAVLRVVGAYIELNPVRAGLAERAEAYRWSGWGAATGGEVPQSLRAWARAGIVGMLAGKRSERAGSSGAGSRDDREMGEEARKFLESYGLLLRVKDESRPGGTEHGGPIETTAAYPLLCRLPALLRGAVVGTQEFVTEWLPTLGGRRTPKPDLSLRYKGEPAVFHARTPRADRATAGS